MYYLRRYKKQCNNKIKLFYFIILYNIFTIPSNLVYRVYFFHLYSDYKNEEKKKNKKSCNLFKI